MNSKQRKQHRKRVIKVMRELLAEVSGSDVADAAIDALRKQGKAEDEANRLSILLDERDEKIEQLNRENIELIDRLRGKEKELAIKQAIIDGLNLSIAAMRERKEAPAEAGQP